MSPEIVLSVFSEALWLAIRMVAPMLLMAMGIGLIIAILQAATQVQEQTMTFAPKLIGIAVALLIFGPWMMNQSMDFMKTIFERVSQIGM
ncbi:MAG: flagellar biosynthesis protein FliQ [Oscillospiraceae bacterium]|nr:flagellar biosynthesis protein FliQ [Oscillospiraceae bacterium]